MSSTDNYVCGNLLGLLASLSVQFKFFLGLRKIQTKKLYPAYGYVRQFCLLLEKGK